MVVTSRRCAWRRQDGVTLVELIAVMVIIAVLASFAAARFFERKSFDADAFTDQSRAMLRYAQKLAIGQNREVYVRLDGNSVALCFDSACSAANRVIAPSGANSGGASTNQYCANSSSWYCEGRPRNITYTLSPAGDYAGTLNFFYFDAQGKPFFAGDAKGSATSAFKRLEMSIGGDGLTRKVTVEPETGYVH